MDVERQARLEAILENAVDAIITIDETGVIEVVNAATEKLFGYQAQDMLGKNVKMLMPSPHHDEHDGYLERYRETGERKIIGIGREVLGRRKDGRTFPVHLAVSEFRAGIRRLFTGIIRDISDLKEAERKLMLANEELEERVCQRTRELHEAQAELLRKEKLATLGQVSGGIAHEIRNPLNAVKTSTYYLLNARDPTPEKTREHLERIDRQVTLIDNVVTALSDVARMPDPRMTTQDTRLHIDNVLATVSLPSSIVVEVEIPEQIPLVLADGNQLAIVLRNLVRNAREAMPEGGTMRLGAYARGDLVSIFVTDTGMGIPPEDISRVTEPLYTTKARGMGLGLAISLAIIHKNRGQLRILSRLGEGSTFEIELAASHV